MFRPARFALAPALSTSARAATGEPPATVRDQLGLLSRGAARKRDRRERMRWA